MTSAHRPNWVPARGVAGGGSTAYAGAPTTQRHKAMLPSHKELKSRASGQGTEAELAQRDFKAELLAREAAAVEAKEREKLGLPPVAASPGSGNRQLQLPPATASAQPKLPASEVAVDEAALNAGLTAAELAQLQDAGADDDDSSDEEGGSGKPSQAVVAPATAGTAGAAAPTSGDGEASDFGSDSDSSSDDEDDEEELQRMLEKIREERDAAAAARRAEKEKEDAARKEADLAGSNPLLDLGASATASSAMVRRRWDEDVIFRNQARDDKTKKKRFINDTIRNDFHRSFMNKYIK